LSVKYGKDGKPVPQYDGTAPTDYGEEGVPTPVVAAGGNAGLLREGVPKRLSKQQRAIQRQAYLKLATDSTSLLSRNIGLVSGQSMK
jgi:hypothetical protein